MMQHILRENGLRETLKEPVYKVFNDDVMIGLAAILAFSVILPLLFEFTSTMQAIFEAINYFIIAAFVAEYILKLYVDVSRISFVTNPWHVLDLLIIVIALFDFSKLTFVPYMLSEQSKLSPVLRLLRVLLRVLLAFTLAGRTAERVIPSQTQEDPGRLKSELEISMLKLDKQGNNVVSKCSMKRSSCTIVKDGGEPVWIDYQHIAEIDLNRIEKETTISRNVLESKLVKESFPRIDNVKGIPTIFLWDSQVESTNSTPEKLNITINDMLVVCEDHMIVTLNRLGSNLFDKISRKPLPLKEEEFAVRVLYSLLRQKIDDYGEIVQRIEQKTTVFEEIPVDKTSPQFLEETFHFKKEIQKISSNLWHFHQVLHQIINKENLSILKIKNSNNFDNLHAESEYMYETAKNIKESLISLIELHINTVSYDMNRVMKVIAVITCLAIIPSIIGGLLGVNLVDSPYPLKITEIFLIVFSLMLLGVYAFYKMGWLR